MKTLLDNPWAYTLVEDDNGRLLLTVVCGTVAIFEITIALTEEECAKFAEKGESFISDLAHKVTYHPDEYYNTRGIK